MIINLLPDQFVFTERVFGFTTHSVYWSLLHLLFNCSEEDEQRLTNTLLPHTTYVADLKHFTKQMKKDKEIFVLHTVTAAI